MRKTLFVLFLSIGCVLTGSAQTVKKITGTVTDAQGEAIIGASVVSSEKNGTITDIDGNFSLETSSSATLTFSYLGYLSKKVAVGNSSHLNIELQEDVQKLDEVIVVGYGTQKKGSITGSVVAVGNRELSITKNQNAQNMLTGKAPGVRVIQKTSEPGEFNNQFDIRGFGDPLIIVDGIPRGNETFARLSPEEIESISVLKDASAAVYGVKAANGVVLITTKKGEKGRSKVNYSMFYGIQTPSDLLKPMNALDRMILANTKSMRSVSSPELTYSDEQMEAYRNGERQSTDWYDAVLTNTAAQQQHAVSVSGGTEKSDYFLNFGYMQQDGFFRSGDLNYDRFNLRANLNAKVTNRLKVSLNLNGIMDNKMQPQMDSYQIYGYLWRMSPENTVYANNNPGYFYHPADIQNVLANTIADVSGFVRNNRKMFQSQGSFTYDVPYIAGLSLTGMYSYDMDLTNKESFRKEFSEYDYDAATDTYAATLRNDKTKFTKSYNLQQTHLWNVSLNYNRSFLEKHNVSALLLYEEKHRTGDYIGASRELDIPAPYLYAGNVANQQVDGGRDYLVDYVTKGLVGRLNYDFAGKYLAEFSFRYDGSSQFAKAKQWGFFPGGSLGWRMSEEAFIKENLSFVQNLKLRASYGVLGDDGSLTYQWVTGYDYPADPAASVRTEEENREVGYTYPGGYVFNGVFVNALGFRVAANPYITWYTSHTVNLGIDSDMWNGLLGFSFDIFQRNREGLLATRQSSVPGTYGTTMPQENLNSDRTKGFEIELRHRNKIGDVTYNIAGNVAMTRTMMHYVERAPAGNSYDNWRNNTNNRYNDIWFGYSAAGRYTSYDQIANSPVNVGIGALPGDYIYEDWNGDGVIDDQDRHPIATTTNPTAAAFQEKRNYPLMNFGLTIGAQWRGFDLSMLFQGSAMSYISYGEQLSQPLMWGGNAVEMFNDRWYPADPKSDPYNPNNTWIPGYYSYGGTTPDLNSEFSIQNGSYLRMKTVELGYTIPQKPLKKAGIQSLRVYVNAYNLLTITGVKGLDPERPTDNYGQMYPLNKTVNFGLNVEF